MNGEARRYSAGLLDRVVSTEPFASGGMSGSQLERGRLDDGTSIVIKRVDANADWIMQATGDEGRIATLWSEGIFGCWSRFVERSGPQDARHMAGVSVAERHAVIR